MSNSQLIPYRKGDKWGFCTKPNRTAHANTYIEVSCFVESLAKCRNDEGLWGYLDIREIELTPFIYVGAFDFSEGYAAVTSQGNWQFSYDYFKDILVGAKWGFINLNGEESISRIYDDVRSFSEGCAAVELNGKWGFIDKSGIMVLPNIYDGAFSFSEGYAAVELEGKWGFINSRGQLAIPFQYEKVYRFSEGIAAVSKNGWSWGFIDGEGNLKIPFKFDYIDWQGIDDGFEIRFSDGLANVPRSFRSNIWDDCKIYWGFIDVLGNERVPFKYELAYSFSEGNAAVLLSKYLCLQDEEFDEGEYHANTKWGYIDVDGKETIPFKYDNAKSFCNGLADVGALDQGGFIDQLGIEYWDD